MRIWVKNFLLLIGFVLLVIMRMPHILFGGGRFWAEEGGVYFHSALVDPWYKAWFIVAFDAGYVNFAAGFGTWLGLQLGGVMYAPLVTVLFALLVQCLPVYIAITHDFPWRRSVVATATVVALIAIPPVTGEVWLNTITSQFHLALTAALIYAAAERRIGLYRIDCAILGFAVISGPATSFLMPLFVLDALMRRDRKSVVQAGILFVGFAVQVTIFLLVPLALRGGHLPVAQLLSVISLHTIFLQFAGLHAARGFARYLGARHVAHEALWAGAAIFLLFYGLVAGSIVRVRDLTLARLLVAGVVIGLVSFHEAWASSFDGLLHVVDDQRYAFAPMVIDALLVVGIAAAARERWRWGFAMLGLVLLIIGALNFRSGLAMFRTGPKWHPQVAAWRKNPQVVVHVWPGWPMAMPKSAVRDRGFWFAG